MTLSPVRELVARAERTFAIWGPNSGGGETVLVVEGRVYDIVYGDESPSPGGAEHVRAVYAPADYASTFGSHPMHAPVIAYLRDRGLL